MNIERYSDCYLDSLNSLLKESFPNVLVKKKSKAKESDIELVCLNGDIVVGYLVLNRIYDSIRDISYCYANYVCVHSNYRNQHIGTKLLEEAFRICKEEGISYIELTTNPSRVAAHGLYKKMGFVERSTDVFRKEIL